MVIYIERGLFMKIKSYEFTMKEILTFITGIIYMDISDLYVATEFLTGKHVGSDDLQSSMKVVRQHILSCYPYIYDLVDFYNSVKGMPAEEVNKKFEKVTLKYGNSFSLEPISKYSSTYNQEM